MTELHISEGEIKARVTYLEETKGNFAYLELSLGPVRQRGYVARARLNKSGQPWVEITAPQQKGTGGKFHVISFIDDNELWLFAIKVLSSAYSEALEVQGISLDEAADYNSQKEVPEKEKE